MSLTNFCSPSETTLGQFLIVNFSQWGGGALGFCGSRILDKIGYGLLIKNPALWTVDLRWQVDGGFGRFFASDQGFCL